MANLTLAIGPMFSGKTEWLIKKLEGFDKERTLAIRYSLDTRYSNDSIVSHTGKKMIAKSATSIADIYKHLDETPNIKVLGIDEIQFFEPELAQLLSNLRNKGITIFASGLNFDYLASPWNTTVALEKIADNITILTARCSFCKKNNAVYTQRIGGETNRIALGGIELYQPRCKEHYAKAPTS